MKQPNTKKPAVAKKVIPIQNFKYELTIGMIFRDDIAYIRKCLETLQPLRDAIPCQLIMTDTGSTDGSREVAEEFADILLDFPWCDNFAAARNTAVELAEGRWFMYCDTDNDYDDSIQEMIKFMNSKDSHHMDSVNMPIYNYRTATKNNNYRLTYQTLGFNFALQGKRYFIGNIHEAIPTIGERRNVDMIHHHWGYTDKTIETKRLRNELILLKEIEADPTVLRNHKQLIKGRVKPGPKKEALLAGLAMAESQEKPNYYDYATMLLMGLELASLEESWDQYKKTEKTLLSLAPHFDKNALIWAEYLAIDIESKFKEKNYEKSLSQCEEYFKKYNEQKVNPDQQTVGLISYERCHELKFYDYVNYALKICYELRMPEKGKEILHTYKSYTCYNDMDQLCFLNDYLHYAMEWQEYSVLPEVYQFLHSKNEQNEINKFRNNLDHTFRKLPEENKQIVLKLMTQNVIDDYTALLSLRKKNFEPKAFTKQIKAYITEDAKFFEKPVYMHLLYGYIRTREDPLDYLLQANSNELVKKINLVMTEYPDTIELVEQAFYDPNFAIKTLKEEKLWAYLGMRTCLAISKQRQNENALTDVVEIEEQQVDLARLNKLFSQTIPLMYGYINKVYNPYLLSHEGVGFVPLEELFSVFATNAINAKNPMEMVQSLKEAAEICPIYVSIVEAYSSKFSNLLQQ
ncbi:MAG: glycosyltransferase [Eubacteriales bacterium]